MVNRELENEIVEKCCSYNYTVNYTVLNKKELESLIRKFVYETREINDLYYTINHTHDQKDFEQVNLALLLKVLYSYGIKYGLFTEKEFDEFLNKLSRDRYCKDIIYAKHPLSKRFASYDITLSSQFSNYANRLHTYICENMMARVSDKVNGEIDMSSKLLDLLRSSTSTEIINIIMSYASTVKAREFENEEQLSDLKLIQMAKEVTDGESESNHNV